jgi:hypothetical protein
LRPSIRIYRDVTYVEGARPTTYVIGEVTYPTTTGNTVGAAERVANAHLVAAAPELLSALENLWRAALDDSITPELRDASRAAIAKAKPALSQPATQQGEE